MESHTLELFPDRGQVHLALFRNVTNAAQLRERLLSQDDTLSCALIDASLVINVFHALLAVNRAFLDESRHQLKTHNIHSEIVFDFSPNAHIAQSLRRFGISDTSKDILVIKVGGDSVEAEQFMKSNVQGDLVPLDQFAQVRDIKSIEKCYQVGEHVRGSDPDNVLQLVAGAMALKGL